MDATVDEKLDLLIEQKPGRVLSIDADNHDVLIPHSGIARTVTVVDALGQTWELGRVEAEGAPFWDLATSP